MSRSLVVVTAGTGFTSEAFELKKDGVESGVQSMLAAVGKALDGKKFTITKLTLTIYNARWDGGATLADTVTDAISAQVGSVTWARAKSMVSPVFGGPDVLVQLNGTFEADDAS